MQISNTNTGIQYSEPKACLNPQISMDGMANNVHREYKPKMKFEGISHARFFFLL